MSRVSQAQAQENRARTVAAASHLLRERGVDALSIADLMKSVGMTTGGFYKQFASKEALVSEATDHAFGDLATLLTGFDEQHDDRAGAREAVIDFYLSTEHRDHPGVGCPAAGLAGDMAREAGRGEAHVPYTNGLEQFAQWLSGSDRAEGDEQGGRAESDGLATMATLVGAVLLARAAVGTDLSEAILKAARQALDPEKGTASAR
ncbi:TetR/AcrR family transcriptional regulator [Streptomyces sp. NBC_01497]|uniref:TetR/AcrR family transcriptional regulator n=1 Tax=Streptomyces sp. NBC_01497 TaxID=2903885 RepID=UPI002E37CF92|nr:TetR/AcrR family transcriptional regulator [Streptomyces sp. NBC_01497]